MALDPAAAFQAAQTAVLEGSAELAAVMGLPLARIYVNQIETDAPLDYVLTGDDQVLDDASSTSCREGSEIFATVHVWAADGGRARAIGGVLRGLLNVELPIAGFDVPLSQYVSANYFTDADGSTHGVLLFRYLVTPQA